MKTTLRMKIILGLGGVLALVMGSGCATQDIVAKTEPSAAAMVCTACKTSIVTAFSPANVSGKWAPRYVPVGTKHACAKCGDTSPKVLGKTASEMKMNCPVCASNGCCSG